MGAPPSISALEGVEEFLDVLRSQIKDRSFCPLPVRERMIPKTGGKLRRLGIPTVSDRVVQASLKLVLEPSKKAVLAVKRKIKTLRRTVEPNQPLDDLLRRLNATLRGWCGYFRAGVSSAVFAYLSHYVWQTVWRWIRRNTASRPGNNCAAAIAAAAGGLPVRNGS
jgi:Group II intron, maturase-specific domain